MKRKIILTTIFTIFALTLFADKADDYLKNIDKMIDPGKDMTAIANMVLISKNGKEEERKMKTYRKGEKKIFFFLKPAGVKGVTFLTLSDDQMYIYMPAFKKIRRIASSAKNENFMGTDMSYEDLAETSYSKKYTPKLVSETGDEAVLELIAKKGSDAAYSKLIITTQKKTWLRKSMELYNKSGKLIKKMNIKQSSIISGYPTPTEIVMKDMSSGHSTKMIMDDVKYDSGLKDSLFSKRKIKRIK